MATTTSSSLALNLRLSKLFVKPTTEKIRNIGWKGGGGIAISRRSAFLTSCRNQRLKRSPNPMSQLESDSRIHQWIANVHGFVRFHFRVCYVSAFLPLGFLQVSKTPSQQKTFPDGQKRRCPQLENPHDERDERYWPFATLLHSTEEMSRKSRNCQGTEPCYGKQASSHSFLRRGNEAMARRDANRVSVQPHQLLNYGRVLFMS